MDINLLFKIAAIGILVAVLHQVLVRAGREVLGVVMRNARFYRAPDVQKLYVDGMVSSSARMIKMNNNMKGDYHCYEQY